MTWNRAVIPGVRTALFQPADRPGYDHLQIPIAAVKSAILGHTEFTAFNQAVTQLFDQWQQSNIPRLIGFDKDGHPKALIETIAEDLLATFKAAPLLVAIEWTSDYGASLPLAADLRSGSDSCRSCR